MTIDQALTDQERAAELDEAQLRQLIGLVEHDVSRDPFPISGWDALVWTVGNATQAALFFQAVYGMELVAYAGPGTGLRDHVSYVLRSGAVRFVLNGAVRPDSPLVAVHGRHGDGICNGPCRCPMSTSASRIPVAPLAAHLSLCRTPADWTHCGMACRTLSSAVLYPGDGVYSTKRPVVSISLPHQRYYYPPNYDSRTRLTDPAMLAVNRKRGADRYTRSDGPES